MSQLIEISDAQLQSLIAKVNRLSHESLTDVLDTLGQQQEDAARERIRDTKKSPDGTRWKAWSRSYAKTRESQHSLLRDSGALDNSMTHVVDTAGKAVEIGSNMVYARAQLRGYGKLPARAYLDEPGEIADPNDRDELRGIVEDFLDGMLS